MSSEERPVLLKVEGLKKHFPITKGVFRRQVGAVKEIGRASCRERV